jgi:hypothetical protein
MAARLQHLELAGEDARLRHIAKGRGAEVGLHSQEAGPEIRLQRETARLWELVHLLVGLERAQRQRIHLAGGGGGGGGQRDASIVNGAGWGVQEGGDWGG